MRYTLPAPMRRSCRMYDHILVTGGAGFAGSALVISLKRAFPEVAISALDNLHRRGSELNLPELRRHGIRFLHADVRQKDDLLDINPPPDLIIEASAEPSVQSGYSGSPDYVITTNLTGCFNSLELARRVGADIILLSTSRVYPFSHLNAITFMEEATRFKIAAASGCPGLSARGIAEDFPLDGPRSIYGTTKLAAELLVEEYGDAFGIRYIIDRFSVLSGPGQMAKLDQGVIALWAAAHVFEQPLSYIGFGGTGKQVRDVLHVDDFCDLVIDQVRNFSLYCGRRFNAGGGEKCTISLLETTALCQELTGRKVPIGAEPPNRRADVRIYISDNSNVSGVNGWRPRREVRETLADIIQWLNKDAAYLKHLFFS